MTGPVPTPYIIGGQTMKVFTYPSSPAFKMLINVSVSHTLLSSCERTNNQQARGSYRPILILLHPNLRPNGVEHALQEYIVMDLHPILFHLD